MNSTAANAPPASSRGCKGLQLTVRHTAPYDTLAPRAVRSNQNTQNKTEQNKKQKRKKARTQERKRTHAQHRDNQSPITTSSLNAAQHVDVPTMPPTVSPFPQTLRSHTAELLCCCTDLFPAYPWFHFDCRRISDDQSQTPRCRLTNLYSASFGQYIIVILRFLDNT